MPSLLVPNQPTVIISFDFEIGWGDVTNTRWAKREKSGIYKKLRFVLKDLLSEFDSLEIPATWATVGAMTTAPKELSLDHLPEKAKNTVHHVLKTAQNDSFDGRDLFEMVLSTDVKHSIASHSYSHIPFDYEGVDETFVREELNLALDSLSRYGVSTDRFVFPENTEGYYSCLAEMNFKVARVGAINTLSSRYQYLLSTLYKDPPACQESIHKEGIIKQHGSMLFNMGRNRYHRLPFVYARSIRGLEMACRENETLHVWAHPFNFAESKLQLKAFKSFLRKIAHLRDTQNLKISPM